MFSVYKDSMCSVDPIDLAYVRECYISVAETYVEIVPCAKYYELLDAMYRCVEDNLNLCDWVDEKLRALMIASDSVIDISRKCVDDVYNEFLNKLAISDKCTLVHELNACDICKHSEEGLMRLFHVRVEGKPMEVL